MIYVGAVLTGAHVVKAEPLGRRGPVALDAGAALWRHELEDRVLDLTA